MSETCQAIWNNLKDTVFPENSENVWIQKANEFEEVWDFPNCIGAVDGKHIVLQVYKICIIIVILPHFLHLLLNFRLHLIVDQHFIIIKVLTALYFWHLQMPITALQS